MRLARVWLCGLTVAAAAACGGGQEPAKSASTPAAAAPASASAGRTVDRATAGEVKGRVSVDGTVPPNPQIKMNADPICLRQAGGPQEMETYVVGADKTLGNVFVYVKDGLGDYAFETPTDAVKIDQKGCRYTPHVLGIRVGQPLEIMNSDPTLHNVHAMAKSNREFNNGQPIQGMKTVHTFTAAEVMVPFKCDVHGWMNAFIGVVDHPYFAVTDASGTFSLPSLPAGTYTIEAWHEKLGTTSQSVTLGANETKEISFTFKSPAASTN